LGGGAREQQKKTVSGLCQSDRHFLALSDTARKNNLLYYNVSKD